MNLYLLNQNFQISIDQKLILENNFYKLETNFDKDELNGLHFILSIIIYLIITVILIIKFFFHLFILIITKLEPIRVFQQT